SHWVISPNRIGELRGSAIVVQDAQWVVGEEKPAAVPAGCPGKVVWPAEPQSKIAVNGHFCLMCYRVDNIEAGRSCLIPVACNVHLPIMIPSAVGIQYVDVVGGVQTVNGVIVQAENADI